MAHVAEHGNDSLAPGSDAADTPYRPETLMKLSTVALLVACGIAAVPAAAQTAPSQVTEAQIAEYKRAAAAACREGGKTKGDPEAKVDAVCSCLMQSLDKTMSATEWRQVVVYSRTKDASRERDLLLPHLKKVEACPPQP